MSVLAFRPEFYLGTEAGGNEFPMTRKEVADCLRFMRRDNWKVSKEAMSFRCTDLLNNEVCTIRPISQATVGAMYESLATYYDNHLGGSNV